MALKAHYDDLLNDKTKKYGTAAKKKLASILQQAQTDMNAAESCERVTAIYEKGITMIWMLSSPAILKSRSVSSVRWKQRRMLT